MRALLHELSGCWQEAGVSDQPNDIYFLTLEQMIALAGAPKFMQAVVQAQHGDQRQHHVQVEALQGRHAVVYLAVDRSGGAEEAHGVSDW